MIYFEILDVPTKRDSKTAPQVLAVDMPKEEFKLPVIVKVEEEKKVVLKEPPKEMPQADPKMNKESEQKLFVEVKEDPDEVLNDSKQDQQSENKVYSIHVELVDPPHPKDGMNMVVIEEEKDEQKSDKSPSESAKQPKEVNERLESVAKPLNETVNSGLPKHFLDNYKVVDILGKIEATLYKLVDLSNNTFSVLRVIRK